MARLQLPNGVWVTTNEKGDIIQSDSPSVPVVSQPTPNPTLQGISTISTISNRQSILDSASQSLSDIQKRIATEGITDASGKVLLAPIEPIGSIVQAPTGTGAIPPSLPQPQEGGINDTFTTSMSADLEAKRKAVEDAYAKQLADLKTQTEASQKKIDDLTTLQQEGAIDKAKELSQPFRDALEKTKNEELYITKNFEENQKLTNELSTLLTEGNDLIRQQKETTGLEAIRNPRINQTISDVNARAGVIQAVMSARSGQIAEAQRMIDRTVSAITADRKDQLSYYSTLYDFYQNKKDEEGKKLTILSSDKKKFLEAQIGMLENDLKTVEDNAQKMKDLFIDPDTALKFAKAGISLNTPQSEWGKKLADQSYAEEVAKVSNERANDGYSTTPISSVAPIQTIDSRGVVKNWYKAGAKERGAEAPTIKNINGVDMQWNTASGKWETISGSTTTNALGNAIAGAKIDNINNILTSSAMDSTVGPSGLARTQPGLWAAAKRFFAGALAGAGVGAVAGAPFAGVGAIPGALIGALTVGFVNSLRGSKDQLTGDRQNFIGTVVQMTAELTKEKLAQAKGQGVTFGALSDGERGLIANAATKIGSWEIHEGGDREKPVIGYNIDEKSFKKEIDIINYFVKLDAVIKGATPESVGAVTNPDGSVWIMNSDGTFTQLKQQ